jgi:hypothetical protein
VVLALRRRRRFVVLGGCAVLVGAGAVGVGPGVSGAHRLSAAPRCPIFPADNSWNQRVSGLPVAADSARYIAVIGLSAPVHPDFGTVWDGAPNGTGVEVSGRVTPET